jgi:hypothetical protein
MAWCRLLTIGVALLVPTAVWAQPASDAAAGRTSWGAPDLQGVWYFNTSVPLERAPTAAEAEAIMSSSPPHWRAPDVPPQETTGAYNAFWTDVATDGGQQTSQIIDPADGRIPAILPGVEIQVGSVWADLPGTRPVRYRSGGIGTDGPEDRGVAVRCIIGFNSGPPMVGLGYNNNMQLFQSEDYVVILNEMVHDARIVPLDGRAHLPGGVRQWMGDSRGRWDGDTLVVETTNFTNKTSSFSPYIARAIGDGAHLTLVERFSRVDAETLRYEYTVTDPATFSRPFTSAIEMVPSDGPIFEFACHEGNHGLANILAGARAAEKTEKE